MSEQSTQPVTAPAVASSELVLRVSHFGHPIELSKRGIPMKSEDWTVEDWRDLHCTLEATIRKIAARHQGQLHEPQPTYYVKHPDGTYSPVDTQNK